jgi:hypothetical protein
MIVKDRVLTHEKARDIATKIIETISKESTLFNDEGDPAEQIYLFVHTIATLNAQFIMSMDGYAKIYGIPNFDGKVFREWVKKVEDEICAQNENVSDEVCEQFKKEIQ